MGSTGTIRFRVIVLFLMALIIWQAYKLFPIGSPGIESDEHVVMFPEEVIELSVYYEALCPDSRHFFIHHLFPTYNKLKENIFLMLIPYGKAKTFFNPNGMLDFECQHGVLECQANKIHACTIAHTEDALLQLEMVNCMIKDNMDPEQALSRCGSLFSIDTELISECAKGSEGAELLKKHGEVTNALKPTFIPTILINGVKENQGGLLKNFHLEFCKYFKALKIPQGCAS